MRKLKRIVSVLLAILIILGTIPSYATHGEGEYPQEDEGMGPNYPGDPGGEEEPANPGYEKIVNFQELRDAIRNPKKPQFVDKFDVNIYRYMNYDPVFDLTNTEGLPINYDSVITSGFWMYGGPNDISKEQGQRTDLSGNILYLGYTMDGRAVPNILYNETKLKNPVMEDPRQWSGTGKHYSGNARPFLTDYTDPLKVGEMFLGGGSDTVLREEYGDQIIRHWMLNTVFRDTGWYPGGEKPGESFGNFFTLEDYKKYVTVTIPPTSKTNGQAIVWFTDGASETRRTFIIKALDPIDYIAENDTWNEETKTLTLYHSVTGIDPLIGDPVDHYIEFDDPDGTNFKWEKYDNDEIDVTIIDDYLDDGGISVVRKKEYDPVSNSVKLLNGIEGNRYTFRNLHPMTQIRLRSTGHKGIKFDMSEYINDVRPTDTEVRYTIYSEMEMATRANNTWTAIIPATTGVDYSVKVDDPKVKIEGDITDIKVKAELKYNGMADDEEAITTATLHDKTGKEIDRIENIKFTKDKKEQEIEFEVDTSKITEDVTEYHVVINADFDLTESDPDKREPKDLLKDNKIKIELVKAAVDYKVTTDTSTIKIEGNKTDIKVKAELEHDEMKDGDEAITTATLHDKTGKEIDRKENIKFTKSKKKQEIKFEVDTSKITEDLTRYYVVINADYNLTKSDPDTREPKDVLKDNKVTVELTKRAADFELVTTDTSKKAEKGKNVDIQFNVSLNDTTEEIVTNVGLYKGSTQVQNKVIKIKGGSSGIVRFTISASSLSEGNNTFTAVVNSNLNLTAATPYTPEVDLTNNKDSIIVDVRAPAVVGPVACEFNRSGGLVDYANPTRPCVSWDHEGYCTAYKIFPNWAKYDLQRNSEMEYVKPYSDKENGIFSDDWHRVKDGQEFGKKNSLPNGKDIKGNPAKNDLMAAVGYNPLRQVIQAGAGIQVRTKIKVTGYVENEGSQLPDSVIKAYIDGFKKDSIKVYGNNVTGVARNIRNNNGDYSQKMEYDSSRPSPLNIVNKGHFVIGRDRYGIKGRREIHMKEFEAEIPVIISTATGTIDVLGGKKAPVPAERKWFVYMNELNNTGFGFKIGTIMKPNLLGGNGGNVECMLDNVPEFRFGVYGTIFDNINIQNPGGDPIWDN